MRVVAGSRVVLVVAATLTVWSCSKPNADEHVKKGDEYAANAMTREAVIEYRTALQADPMRGDVRLKLGDTYMKLQELAPALSEYVRAADLLPENLEAQLKAGSLLLLAGRFEDAKSRANVALTLDPKSAAAQVLLGNTLAGLKDFDGAIAEYQQALALNPSQDQAYQNMAIVQMGRGNVAEAEAAFRKAVEVAPKSVQARLGLAGFLWATGRAPLAETTLKEALTLEPANLAANRALGMFYIGSNRMAEAEPHFKTIAKTANEPPAFITLADYYLISKRYQEARDVLTELQTNPDAYAGATIRLAAIDVALGARAEAQAKLRELLEKHPTDMAGRLFSARLLVLDGKRDEALARAMSIVTDDPNSPAAVGAYELIGGIQASVDRPEDAIKAFEEVAKRQQRPVGAYLALARLHRTTGDLEKASSYLRDANALEPALPGVRAESVRVLLAQGQLAKARAELAKLRTEFPQSPTVLNLLAAQQLADGQVQAARASYAKAAALAPADLEALAGLVDLDVRSKQVKDAVARVEAGLKVMAPTGNLLVLGAKAYAAAGDLTKAEEFLKKAIEIEPARLEAYNLLALLYVQQRRLSEAEDNFRLVVTRNPSSVAANTMLGLLYDLQRRTAEAEQQYRHVLTLDPEAAVAANNLAWIYVASNRNLPEALQLARTAQQKLPDEPNVDDTLGWIYYHQKKYSDAIRHLEASAQKRPNEAAIHYHLGMAYAAFGESAKARQSLTKALSFKTNFEGEAEARKALQEIAQ